MDNLKQIETESVQNEKAYYTALQTREFEIVLFWKRSLFFWGFIASAFAGYIVLKNAGSSFAVLIACFGLVCSIAWTLVNRGSKYWQENWEQKLERHELAVTGPLFQMPESIKNQNALWLRARKYSVSKLTIALSDFTAAIWFFVLCYHIMSIINKLSLFLVEKQWMLLGLIILTFVYVAMMIWKGKTTKE